MSAGAARTALLLLLAAILVTACQATASAPPARETTRLEGPGWSLDVPVDLGLQPEESSITDITGTWSDRDGRQLGILIWPDANEPLDAYVADLEGRPGTTIQRRDPVALPAGRGVYALLSNDLAPDSHVVMIEPRPGLIASISAVNISAGDLVGIARTFRGPP